MFDGNLKERDLTLPDPERMWKAIQKDDDKVRRRYVRSPRHTIEVDFYPYLRIIERERKRGRRRARGRRAQPPQPAQPHVGAPA